VRPGDAGAGASLADADASVVVTPWTQLVMTSLLPGRNYSFSVLALALGMESAPVAVHQATRPSSPIIEELTPVGGGLNVSWKSDVTSKQVGTVLDPPFFVLVVLVLLRNTHI